MWNYVKKAGQQFLCFCWMKKVLWQIKVGLNWRFLSQKIPLVNSWGRSQSQQRFPAARRWGRRVFVGGWGLAGGVWTPRQSYWRPSVLWWPAGREVSSFWTGEHPSPLPVDRQWVVEQQQSHKKDDQTWQKKKLSLWARFNMQSVMWMCYLLPWEVILKHFLLEL